MRGIGLKKVMAFGAAISQGDWPVQEDAYWVEPMNGIFVLGNGCGGKAQGDRAAAAAVARVGQSLLESLDSTESIEHPHSKPQFSNEENALYSALTDANAQLFTENEALGVEERAGVSILAVQFLASGRAILGNVGSNAAAIFRAGKQISLIVAQSFAASQGSVVGTVSPRFGQDFPVTTLGAFAQVEPEVRTCHFQADDHLFLYSDGFMNGVSEGLIAQCALLANDTTGDTNLEDQAREFLSLAESSQQWHKNSSVILIGCGSNRDLDPDAGTPFSGGLQVD